MPTADPAQNPRPESLAAESAGGGLICQYCEQKLCGEEADGPRMEFDEPVCDECWHERHEFTCSVCAEDGDDDDQHILAAVFEQVDDLAPGLYLIVKFPYWADGMIEGHLFYDAFERLGDAPERSGCYDYPMGHLCCGCQQKALGDRYEETVARSAERMREAEAATPKTPRPDGLADESATGSICRCYLESEDPLRDAIEAALMSYECQHQGHDGDPSGARLADVLSPGPTIKEGREEIELLADHIAVCLEEAGVAE